MSRVRDIIHNRDLFFVEEQQTVAQAARKMADLHVGAILVLKDNQLSGVFSERDLMNRVVLACREPANTPVGEVMTREIAPLTTWRPSKRLWRQCRPTIAGTCRSCVRRKWLDSSPCAT